MGLIDSGFDEENKAKERDFQPILAELHGAKMLWNVQAEQIINPTYVYAIKNVCDLGTTAHHGN